MENFIQQGDCLKLLSNIEDESIDLILTDPPYGINYKNNRRNKNGRIKTENGILNDVNNLFFLDKVLKELFRVLKDGRHIYWFGRFDSISEQLPLFKKHGFVVKNTLIWKYEIILYAIKVSSKKTKKFKLQKIQDRTRHSDILKYNKISSNVMVHDHQKPTDLLEFLIKKSTYKNEIVLDPFMGSGSTIFSALNVDRKFIGFELDKDIFNNFKRKIMEDRFKVFTDKEKEVGQRFAKLINAEYIKNNNNIKTKVDGILKKEKKETLIELQELRYKKAIDKKEIIIDVLSIFYFKNKKRKRIKINDKDINITKYGKIFTLNNDTIYLIYIDKKNIQNLKNYNIFLQDDKYIFISINVEKLKLLFKEKNYPIFVNDKRQLKDTWESAFSLIKIDELLNNNVILKHFTNSCRKALDFSGGEYVN